MVTWSLKQKKFGKHISPRIHYYTRGTSEEFGAEIMFIKKRGAKDDDGDITLSVEDSTKLREAYKQKVQGLRNEFEKRLDAYLKKYGLSKIRRWTYCADD